VLPHWSLVAREHAVVETRELLRVDVERGIKLGEQRLVVFAVDRIVAELDRHLALFGQRRGDDERVDDCQTGLDRGRGAVMTGQDLERTVLVLAGQNRRGQPAIDFDVLDKALEHGRCHVVRVLLATPERLRIDLARLDIEGLPVSSA
jgi:hypothetical protein